MAEDEFDVAILGAGPVGCALALGLQGSGFSVALVGRPDALDQGGARQPAAVRAIALSYASRMILARFGAWDSLVKTQIDRIHVSQAGGFGVTRISRDDLALPALGYVTAYEGIAPALARCLATGSVHRVNAASPPRARLLVHAEGSPGDGAVERNYLHSAVIATVSSDRPAHGVAWERFTPEGPLALLPMGNDYALVWSRATAAATEALYLPDKRFLQDLQSTFGQRAGKFVAVGVRAATPLALRYRNDRAAPGEIRIGNAAQTLHPVAGQGLNLGLRDAWDLAEQLVGTPRNLHGSGEFARRFARSRRTDAQGTIRSTDLLATLYVRPDPVSTALRGAMLVGLDMFPPARRALARSMIYGPGSC